jgi:hypothetical protein
MRAWALLFLLAACSFEHGTQATDIDATVAGPDSPAGCASFSSQVDTCMLAPSDQDVTLNGANTYDTTMGTLKSGANPVSITRMQLTGKAGPLEVMIVRDFRLMANAKLRATGTYPLAILAFGKIAIDGSAQIDVSVGGAGARTSCNGGAIMGMPNTGGAGGGGGGGFAAAGGNGGNGDKDGVMPTPGGVGGTAAPSTPLGPLGGCPGAPGGNGDDNGGAAGVGGGAIYLVAAQRIDLAPGSGITAGGGGGKGGDAGFLSDGDAGGGGGGSGGMIMIESPIVRGDGVLAANGGGGGEASGNGGSGNPGTNGALGIGTASGGAGNSSSGTDGGGGGAKVTPGGDSVTTIDNGGGGGGGGSVGYIIIKSTDAVVALVSPNPS